MLDSDAPVSARPPVPTRRRRRQPRIGPGIRWSGLRYARTWGARRSAWAFPGYVGVGVVGLVLVGETASSSGGAGHFGVAGPVAAVSVAWIVAFWTLALLMSVVTHRTWTALAAAAARLGA
ncbi:hypothetical protein [Microbacterium sp. NPDC077184]|uniref:hypothetical protein n=1 Tax=Microbacterium sp. NPDC077184 TaxID=3154764 RepID=UPI0034191542